MKSVVMAAIEVTQPVGKYYIGKMLATDLFEMCKFDFRRIVDRGGYKDFLGIQRKLDEKRVKEIKKYIQTVDAVFPTSVVISIDSRTISVVEPKKGYFELKLTEFVDTENPDFTIPFSDIVTIIDGQHRIKAFEDYVGE